MMWYIVFLFDAIKYSIMIGNIINDNTRFALIRYIVNIYVVNQSGR